MKHAMPIIIFVLLAGTVAAAATPADVLAPAPLPHPALDMSRPLPPFPAPLPPGNANLAAVLAQVSGYPARDGAPVHWFDPDVDRPAAAAASPDKATQDANWHVTGVALYHHAVSGLTLPSPNMRVFLYAGNTPDRTTFEAVGWAWCDDDGNFAIDAYTHRYNELRFSIENTALDPTYDVLPPWAWWYTGTFQLPDSGGNADIGYCYPLTENQNAMAHVAASFWRCRWMFYYLTGGDIVDVITQPIYPIGIEDATAYMDDEVVYVNYDRIWRDDVLAAQYGRLWMKQFCFQWQDACGHGMPSDPAAEDCPEWCDAYATEAAYTQGLSRWFGDVIQELYPFYFGYTAVPATDHEDLQACGSGARYPNATAGLFTAVLRDLQDIPADSHGEFGAYTDRLALGYDEIISVAKSGEFPAPSQLLYWMLGVIPNQKPELWETAMNCGYDIDYYPPQTVTGLGSSHPLDVPSADATIEFSWTAADDDASGVAGYSVLVSHDGAAPDQVQDLGVVTSYTTGYLAPGDWFFSIRAVDRVGHWATEVVTSGPYVILPGAPADLEAYARTGWAYPVVPSTLSNSSSISCPAPTTLVGSAGPLYLNVCGRNTGGSSTGVKFGVRCLVDGKDWGVAWGHDAVAPGEEYWILNRGVPAVRGGRHTFEGFHDSSEILPEADEADNRWARQWIWSPTALAPGVPVTRTAPPDPEGGRGSLPPLTVPFRNCDGYRFTSGSDWRAVWIRALDLEDNYDLRLHTASSGPTSGFGLWQAEADRNAGQLDALLVNGHNAGAADWDVGVNNVGRLEGAGSYTVAQAVGTPFALGDSITVTQAEGEMLLLYEVPIASQDLGWLTVTVDVRPLTQRVRVFWFDNDFVRGDLLDRTLGTSTFWNGHASGTVEVTQAGSCGLVVARDPSAGTGPDTLTIEVEPALANLRPILLSHWYSPLVPRPAADGTISLVARPDTLVGNQAQTFYNVAAINQTPAGIPLAVRQIRVDGTVQRTLETAGSGSNTIFADNLTDPNTVRGGRHTLSVVCDPANLVEETLETDNGWAEQFVWSPLDLAFGAPVTRSAPPAPYGGWEDLPADSVRYYNCDGVRLPAGSGHFAGVAVMPGDGCDVDVRLHRPAIGAKQGFGETLAYGHQGPGHTEYVVANLELAGAGPFDAGVVGFGGEAPYTAEAAQAVTLAFDGNDTYGPFTLDAPRLLDLYALHLSAGEHVFTLADQGADPVDWELRLHPADLPFIASTDLMDSLQAVGAGPGEDEVLTVSVPADGWYCLAVAKAGFADVQMDGDYLLTVRNGLSGVGDEVPLPARTALVAVRPNPFNPTTRIVLDLAATERVRLVIFDARGRRVRDLVDAILPSGRKEFVWDGRDDGGRGLPSGTYFAHVGAGAVRQTAKMVLLK